MKDGRTFTMTSRWKSYSKRFSCSCSTGGKESKSTPFLASCTVTQEISLCLGLRLAAHLSAAAADAATICSPLHSLVPSAY